MLVWFTMPILLCPHSHQMSLQSDFQRHVSMNGNEYTSRVTSF